MRLRGHAASLHGEADRGRRVSRAATFVVTVAPPYQRLDEWLAEQDHADAAAKEFGKAGFWKRPEVGALTPPPPPAKAPVVQPAVAEPGEFTRQFQRPPAPAPEPGLPLTAPMRVAVPPPDAATAETDEFAKLFSAPAVEAGTSSPMIPAAAGPAQEAGDFTRMFLDTPVPRSESAPPAPPPSASAEPGEFTKMFQSPAPAPEPGKTSAPVAVPRPTPEPRPTCRTAERTRSAASVHRSGASGRVHEDVSKRGNSPDA